jgi:hypothetical protein
MRPAVIALVGFAALIGVFLLEVYLPLLLVLLNSLALGLILAGTLVPVSSKMGRVVITFKEGRSTSDESLWPCIAGKRINPNFQRPLEFHVEMRGMLPLLFLGILSLSAISFALQVHHRLFSVYQDMDSGRYHLMFLFVFLTSIPLSGAVSWFRERLLLARASVTIGNVNPAGRGFSFVDPNGSNFGGPGRAALHPADNACLVFYSPANPEFNKSSSGLLFHQLVLH